MAFRKQQKRASGQVPELGAIFMSNRATKEMCFSWKTFGLPYTWESFVKQVKAGMFLFLFEHETRMLYGVYQACSDGAMDFSSEAFSSAENNYPAQVKFRVLWYCKPLSEDVFRPAIKDNYFTAHKFKFGLSRNQVRELLWLFHSRMLRGDLLWEEMLPSDPSLIHGATRSCSIAEAREIFTFGVQNGSVPENANALDPNTDLEKFSMPNREVRGSLLIEGDRDNAHEDADFNLPVNNYKRELSQQHRVTQVRDRMDYGRKSNNDCELNSGVPYMSSDERYDPDIPLFNNMQRFHEDGRFMWDGRVYTDNILDVKNITRQVHFSTRMHHDACDSSLDPLSYCCNSVQKIGVETAVNKLRQSSATRYFEPSSYNPGSGTSLQGQGRCSEVHLNPEVFKVLNNNNINGVLLKPLSGNILLPSEIDDASILRQPVAYYDPSQSISHPGDAPLHFSTACNPVDISQESKVCKESQPVPQNKQSVFSRLKPALDADDECDLKDPQKSIDDMVNEVMENLSGHYRHLVRESNSPTKRVDDGDNNSKNKMKMKKPRTLQSEAANYEPVASTEMVFDASTDNIEYEIETGRQIIGEIPCLNFKRRSEVHKKRNADEGGLSEMSSAILAEKQCKRRKLVRPSFSEKKLSNKEDGMLDKISENLSLSRQPVQDGSFKTDVPLSHDKEQNLHVTGNLGSNVGGSASESEKHEGLSFSGPSACDARQLPKQCNLRSGVLDASVDGNSSGQYREESKGAVMSLAFSGNDKKVGYTTLKNTSFGVPPTGVLDIFNKNESGGSLMDPDCTLQLNLNRTGDEMAEKFMMVNGDHKKDGKTFCCDLNVGMKCDAHVGDGVSTKLELGRALNVAADFCVDAHKQHFVSVAEVGDDRSGKSVELVGSQQALRNDLDMNTNEDTKLSSNQGSIF